MFGLRKKVDNLELRIGDVEIKAKHLEEESDQFAEILRDELRMMLKEHKNEVERRLIEFHKEVTDKFFGTIEKIFRWNKEITLIEKLAGNIGNEDFNKLRTALLEPVIKAHQEADFKTKADGITKKVESQGEVLLKLRQQTYDKFIEAERKEQPTEFLKGQLDILDKTIGGAK